MLRTAFALILATPCAVLAQTPPTWHLQLDHAIHPAEGTEGVLGNVSYIVVTRSGVVYVAERKSPRVTRYDAAGKFAGVVMRDGEGPREAREPEIALQGDTLVVFDPRLSRVSRVSPAGTLLNQHPVDVFATGFPVWTTRDGSIWIDALLHTPATNQAALRVTTNGHVDTVAWNEDFSAHQWVSWTFSGGVIKGGPYSAAPYAAIDPSGRVVFGGSRASRWYVLSGKDTVQRVVLADHPVTIPRAQRDSAWNAFGVRLASIPGAAAELKKDQLPTVLPAWLTLDINPRGEWWIGRPGLDGKLEYWDVVENGKLVGQASAPPRIVQGPGVYGRAFGADLIALLHEDENAVPWIGVYRIVRGQ